MSTTFQMRAVRRKGRTGAVEYRETARSKILSSTVTLSPKFCSPISVDPNVDWSISGREMYWNPWMRAVVWYAQKIPSMPPMRHWRLRIEVLRKKREEKEEMDREGTYEYLRNAARIMS
jgi:hypothetical protein